MQARRHEAANGGRRCFKCIFLAIYIECGISVIRVKCSVWCFVPWKEDEKGLNHSHFDLNLDE